MEDVQTGKIPFEDCRGFLYRIAHCVGRSGDFFILNRGVSISCVFKHKVVLRQGNPGQRWKLESKPKKLDLGITLVEGTPEKPQVLSVSISDATEVP